MRDREVEYLTADLTTPLKRALIIMLEDREVRRDTTFFIGRSGRKMFVQTIVALGERYLAKIIVEGRVGSRPRQSAALTDAGFYAARGVQNEFEKAAAQRGEPRKISESTARFIAEVTS